MPDVAVGHEMFPHRVFPFPVAFCSLLMERLSKAYDHKALQGLCGLD